MSMNEKDLNEGRINDQLGNQLESLSAQIEAKMERGRNRFADLKAEWSDKASQFGQTMDRYSHEHPWRMVSSALIGGVVLGMLFGFRRLGRQARF